MISTGHFMWERSARPTEAAMRKSSSVLSRRGSATATFAKGFRNSTSAPSFSRKKVSMCRVSEAPPVSSSRVGADPPCWLR